MKYYLSGPMSGYPKFNFPEFNRITNKLRKHNYKIVNPVETTIHDTEFKKGKHDWMYFIQKDINKIINDKEIGGIIFIKGWKKSKGAQVELFTALKIRDLGDNLFEYIEDKKTGNYVLQKIKVKFKFNIKFVDW